MISKPPGLRFIVKAPSGLARSLCSCYVRPKRAGWYSFSYDSFHAVLHFTDALLINKYMRESITAMKNTHKNMSKQKMRRKVQVRPLHNCCPRLLWVCSKLELDEFPFLIIQSQYSARTSQLSRQHVLSRQWYTSGLPSNHSNVNCESIKLKMGFPSVLSCGTLESQSLPEPQI